MSNAARRDAPPGSYVRHHASRGLAAIVAWASRLGRLNESCFSGACHPYRRADHRGREYLSKEQRRRPAGPAPDGSLLQTPGEHNRRRGRGFGTETRSARTSRMDTIPTNLDLTPTQRAALGRAALEWVLGWFAQATTERRLYPQVTAAGLEQTLGDAFP